jgi:hypothetical protein
MRVLIPFALFLFAMFSIAVFAGAWNPVLDVAEQSRYVRYYPGQSAMGAVGTALGALLLAAVTGGTFGGSERKQDRQRKGRR